MKKLFFTLILSFLFPYSKASNDEFSYNKEALSLEFSQLNAANTWVENTNASFQDLIDNHQFEGKIVITNQISVQPNFSFEEMEWIPFAWGLICCPIGFFVVAMDRDASKEEKTSFWIGVIVSVILTAGPSTTYYIY